MAMQPFRLMQWYAGNPAILRLMTLIVWKVPVYIRNLTPFHGGKDSYSVPLQLPQDRRTAIDAARAILTAQEAKIQAFLAYPCNETTQVKNLVVGLSWTCQFVTYHIPAFYHVTGVRIFGKNLLIDVWFVARPVRIWVK